MTAIQRIALVGHCGFDTSSLRRFVETHAPGRTVVDITSEGELTPIATPQTLLLVNRVLDGSFAADTGVELIRDLLNQPHPPRAILISNYDDAQAAAQQAGAMPGFGKSQLRDAVAAQRLKEAVT